MAKKDKNIAAIRAAKLKAETIINTALDELVVATGLKPEEVKIGSFSLKWDESDAPESFKVFDVSLSLTVNYSE